MSTTAAIAAVVGAVAAAGTAAYSIYQGVNASDPQKPGEAPKLPGATKDLEAGDQAAALKAAQDQKRVAAGASGRSGTILTGGLGQLGAPNALPKTLLGE